MIIPRCNLDMECYGIVERVYIFLMDRRDVRGFQLLIISQCVMFSSLIRVQLPVLTTYSARTGDPR
jgi:hypothetical protein